MYIAVFKNIRAVIKAESLCRANDIAVQVMPIPEYLSSECGMCLMVSSRECEFEELMRKATLEIEKYEK